MPRHARLDAPGALHHVMVRGIDKGLIFRDDQDRAKFLDKLGQAASDAKAAVYAFALMSNHVHILFRSGEKGLGTVMRKVLTWYAVYFNRRHKRTGHLFENRYKSILCEEDAYLLTLVRYIHLNPVRGGLAVDMESLDRYPWCSHRMLMGKDALPSMDKDFILRQFAKTRKKAVEAYRLFVAEGFAMGSRPELVGGGLIRSLGGWSKVLSLQGREQHKADERILGSSQFVEQILRETEERQHRQLKIRTSGITIVEIIDEECAKGQIQPGELQNGGRRAKASRTRALVAYRAVTELGLSAAEIARRLGVTTSTITRAVEKLEKGTPR